MGVAPVLIHVGDPVWKTLRKKNANEFTKQRADMAGEYLVHFTSPRLWRPNILLKSVVSPAVFLNL